MFDTLEPHTTSVGAPRFSGRGQRQSGWLGGVGGGVHNDHRSPRLFTVRTHAVLMLRYNERKVG